MIPALATEAEKEVINRIFIEALKVLSCNVAGNMILGLLRFLCTKLQNLINCNPRNQKMSTNKICEHLLAKFSRHADLSELRNKNFSARGIKDKIVLH